LHEDAFDAFALREIQGVGEWTRQCHQTSQRMLSQSLKKVQEVSSMIAVVVFDELACHYNMPGWLSQTMCSRRIQRQWST
jgi:hypothetical protein